MNKNNFDIGYKDKNKWGYSFEVIGIDNKDNKKRIIKFDSGFITEVSLLSIKNCSMKDYYSPTVLGVGIIGDYDFEKFGKLRDNKLYKRWKEMLSRCYNKDDSRYYTYGGRGCYVYNRWFWFTKYQEDIMNKENYDKLLHNNWHIDKDVVKKGNKCYCNEYTRIISPSENISERNLRNGNPGKHSAKRIYMYSVDGDYIDSFEGGSDATRKLGFRCEPYKYIIGRHWKHSSGFAWISEKAFSTLTKDEIVKHILERKLNPRKPDDFIPIR